MVDLSPDVQNGVDPTRTHLLDRNCRPKDSDRTAVLVSFPLNSCGTTVEVAVTNDVNKFCNFISKCSVLQVGKESVTYQNEIFLRSGFPKGENALDGSHDLQRYLPIQAVQLAAFQ